MAQQAEGRAGELAVVEEEALEACCEARQGSLPGCRVHTGCTSCEHVLHRQQLSIRSCTAGSVRNACTKNHEQQVCRVGSRQGHDNIQNGAVSAQGGRDTFQMDRDNFQHCVCDRLSSPPPCVDIDNLPHFTATNGKYPCTATSRACHFDTGGSMTGGITASSGEGYEKAHVMLPPSLSSLKERLAVRVMRRENYLIALVSSGLLSLRVPLPASPITAAALASLLHTVGALLGCHVYIDSESSDGGAHVRLSAVSGGSTGVVGGRGSGALSRRQGGVYGSEDHRMDCMGDDLCMQARASSAGGGAARVEAGAEGKVAEAAGGRQRVVRVTGFSRVLEWVLMWCLLEPMMDR